MGSVRMGLRLGAGEGCGGGVEVGVQLCRFEPVSQAAGLQLGGGAAADPGQPQLRPTLVELVVELGEGVEGG
jgi:hypothetical protein